MPQHLKIFEWLVYGSIAVEAVSTLLGRPTWEDAAAFVVVAIILVALAWAAARRGQQWAAWLVVVLVVLAVLFTIGQFWAGGPAWLREVLRPDKALSPIEKVLDLISTLMLVAAVYFYFFGGGGAGKDRVST